MQASLNLNRRSSEEAVLHLPKNPILLADNGQHTVQGVCSVPFESLVQARPVVPVTSLQRLNRWSSVPAAAEARPV